MFRVQIARQTSFDNSHCPYLGTAGNHRGLDCTDTSSSGLTQLSGSKKKQNIIYNFSSSLLSCILASLPWYFGKHVYNIVPATTPKYKHLACGNLLEAKLAGITKQLT